MSDALAAFLVWCAARGVQVDNRIEFTHRSSFVAVYARDTALIPPNTTLVRIPKSALLSVRTCALAPHIDFEPYGHAAHLSLALALLGELSLGPSSGWYVYLQSLPRATVALALFWGHALDEASEGDQQDASEARTWLVGTEAERCMSLDSVPLVDDIREFYANTVRPLTLRLGLRGLRDNPSPTLHDFVYAYSLVSSRAFMVDAYHGVAMVPVADAFNHTTQNTVHLESEHDVCPSCGSWAECEHDKMAADEPGPMDEQDMLSRPLFRPDDSQKAAETTQTPQTSQSRQISPAAEPPPPHRKRKRMGSENDDDDFLGTHLIAKTNESRRRQNTPNANGKFRRPSSQGSRGASPVAAAELTQRPSNASAVGRPSATSGDGISGQEDTCDMVTNAAIVPHSEVFNTYGESLSNAELLVRYGFMLDENEHDVVSWTRDELAREVRTSANLSAPSTGPGPDAYTSAVSGGDLAVEPQTSAVSPCALANDSVGPAPEDRRGRGTCATVDRVIQGTLALLDQVSAQGPASCGGDWAGSELVFAPPDVSSETGAAGTPAQRRFCVNSEGRVSVSLWLFCALFELELARQRPSQSRGSFAPGIGIGRTGLRPDVSVKVEAGVVMDAGAAMLMDVADTQRAIEEMPYPNADGDSDESDSKPDGTDAVELKHHGPHASDDEEEVFNSARRASAQDFERGSASKSGSRTLAILDGIIRTITQLCANKTRALSPARGSASRMTRLELGELLDALPSRRVKTRFAVTEVLSERALLESCLEGWRALGRAVAARCASAGPPRPP